MEPTESPQPTISELQARKDLTRLEWLLLSKVADICSVSPETKAEIVTRVGDVAKFADKFDYIMVTGSSRIVSRSLLQAAGINPRKFIIVDGEANIQAYKEVDEATSNLTDDERIASLKRLITQKEIPDNRMRVCVVDDHVDSAGKANRYIRIMAQMLELEDYAFTTFSAPAFGEAAARITHISREERIKKAFDSPALAEKFHIPGSADTYNNETDEFFGNLAVVSSVLSSGHSQSHRFSDEVKLAARRGLRDALKSVYTEIQNNSLDQNHRAS